MSDHANSSTNDSNSEGENMMKETCRMARKVNIGKIFEIAGEEIIDERTQYDLEEEAYEEQVALWLRQERSQEVLELAKNPLFFEKLDDFRAEKASGYGGFQIIDYEIQSKLRSAASDIVC